MFQDESLARFDLLDKIDAHLFNFFLSVQNESVCMTRRTGSSTNHNHEELVEDISDFTCQPHRRTNRKVSVAVLPGRYVLLYADRRWH